MFPLQQFWRTYAWFETEDTGIACRSTSRFSGSFHANDFGPAGPTHTLTEDATAFGILCAPGTVVFYSRGSVDSHHVLRLDSGSGIARRFTCSVLFCSLENLSVDATPCSGIARRLYLVFFSLRRAPVDDARVLQKKGEIHLRIPVRRSGVILPNFVAH